jgi:signal transduction histidine kinase
MSDDLISEKFQFKIRYPWRSLLLVKLLIFYVLLWQLPEFQRVLKLPQGIFALQNFAVAALLVLVAGWFDVRRFYREQKKVRSSMNRLWQSRNQLQQRAQTSVSHTEKLKLFISDKLLEYIEYDEKFLHFRSIASEVRHNGVISFDKVQSALHYARDHSLPDEQGSQATLYHEALAAMRYLWDLLDLSTTDNLALHIGNRISQSEELLFEAELQGADINSMPLAPTFSARDALTETLTHHLGMSLCDSDGHDIAQSLLNSDATRDALLMFDRDGVFRLDCQPAGPLLGNSNHLVLLLENLLRNAQYFAARKPGKLPYPGVAVRLWEAQHNLCLTVYNRGPHIADDARDQIFQLGFSTRRVREHHGKGLGLYFVHQIVQGFDGDIGFDNIHNQSEQYQLRMELSTGEIQTLSVNVVIAGGLPLIQPADDGELQKQADMVLSAPLVSLEVSTRSDDQLRRYAADRDTRVLVDDAQAEHPRWIIRLQGRKQERLVFEPQDIRGVRFSVRLPTAQARIEGLSSATLAEPDVDELGAELRSPDDF